MGGDSVEEWKDIDGYEGYYQISKSGMVKKIYGKNQLLRPRINSYGYLYFVLMKDGHRQNKRVHRLIATAFIPLVDGKTVINHVDGNKLNNSIENLEWCTQQENVAHAFRNKLMIAGENARIAQESRKRAVNQYDLYGNLISTYESGVQAFEKTGVQRSKISNCCNGKRKTAGNYIWRFA